MPHGVAKKKCADMQKEGRKKELHYNVVCNGIELGSTKSLLKKGDQGLPWWRSGKESTCQCKGHRFDPWSGKIPHAAEQLSLSATTTEPVL